MTESSALAPTAPEYPSWILSGGVLLCSVIICFIIVLLIRMICSRGGQNREDEIRKLKIQLQEERTIRANLENRMSVLEVEAEGRKSVNLNHGGLIDEQYSEGPKDVPGMPVRRAETPPLANAPPNPLYNGHQDLSLAHLYVEPGNADIPGGPGVAVPGHRGSAIIGMSIDISAGDVTPVSQHTPNSVMMYDPSREELQMQRPYGGIGMLEPQPSWK